MNSIMKRCFSILVGMALALTLQAQNLTVKFENCTVEQAMEQLKSQGISFALKSDSIDVSRKVSASFEDATLEDIIQAIFRCRK